jgi:acyl-coenzyme A thioesterase PaaI-like protein
LEGADGLDLAILIDTAASTAVLTGAPSRSDVHTALMSLSLAEAASTASSNLIARASAIRRTPTLTYVAATVEDDLGRQLAQGTAAVVVQPSETRPMVAADVASIARTDATPDPYERPLPAGVGPILPVQLARLDGLTTVRCLMAEEPLLPLFALFDMRIVRVESRQAVLRAVASQWLCHRDRQVVPGALAAMLRQGMAAASYTVCSAGTRLETLNVGFTFLRPVPADGGQLIAHAFVAGQHDDRVVTAATLSDADCQTIATGHQTSALSSFQQ